MDKFEAAYLPPGTDASDQRISVLKCPDLTNLPTAYVATAGFDPLRDEGEAYALKMRDCGVRVALRRHPGLVHGFANPPPVARPPTTRCARRQAPCGSASPAARPSVRPGVPEATRAGCGRLRDARVGKVFGRVP